MMSNNLVPYKENIFTKISNFFKKLFFRNKNTIKEEIAEIPVHNNEKNKFLEDIVIKEDEEVKRLKALKLQYDNGEIDEDDISEEDIDKIVEMYEKETEELNEDTKRRKANIERMLKELKAS